MNDFDEVLYRALCYEIGDAVLKRGCNADELLDALKYLADNGNDVCSWQDVMDLLTDGWRDKNYFQCQCCGEYYPTDAKLTVHDDYDDGYYYCENCIGQARENAKFDIHNEHGTDGRHTC